MTTPAPNRQQIWHDVHALLGDPAEHTNEEIALYKAIQMAVEALEKSDTGTNENDIVAEVDWQIQEQGYLEAEDYELKEHIKLAEQQKRAYEVMDHLLRKLRHYTNTHNNRRSSD